MKAHVFKAPSSFDEIVSFFNEKFKPAPQAEEISESLKGKNYRYLETDDSGTTLLVAEYKPADSLKDFEKEVTSGVDYALLVSSGLEEYLFLRYNEGTGKLERLKKRRNELEIAFLKKLDVLTFNNLGTLDKLFDRSEFVKEFYDLYCDTEEFLKRKVNGIPEPEDLSLYVKILLNRLMFLWFLQKKELLDYNDNYLADKFKTVAPANSKGGNEYSSFLNALFFQGLCVKPGDRDKKVTQLIGDIPFLNGGLFIESEVEQKYKNISIPNDAFYRPMEYPIAKGEKNIPVLNLFESKEWTIDERSGDVNKINPEVLGYIFEKSINQKGLGAFYTPEEITTYIAQNTIHPFLLDRIKEKTGSAYDSIDDLLQKADEKTLKPIYEEIRNIKILDPAVGSGHFLVDAMLVLQRIYDKLKEKGIHNFKSYQIREHIIKNNLYGVDIVPGAVEICKLRMFLALAETFTSRLEVQPLPNIDFNFRAGNSLIGYAEIEKVRQANLALSGEVITKLSAILDVIKKHYPEQLLLMRSLNEKLQKLEPLSPKEMFDVRTKLVKLYTSEHSRILATELRGLLDNLTDAFNTELNRLLYGELRNKIDALTPEDFGKDKLKAFHWAMEFSEVFESGGFDAVIGNPPYGRIKQVIKEKAEKELHSKLYTNLFRYQRGNYNWYKLFLERTYGLIAQYGYFSMIFPTAFLGENDSAILRKFFFEEARVQRILQFPEKTQVFVGVTQDVIILFYKKLKEEKDYQLEIKTNISSDELRILKNLDFILIKISELFELTGYDYRIPNFHEPKIEYDILKEISKIPPFKGINSIMPIGKIGEGHLHETHDKEFITEKPTGDILVKGIHLDAWKVDLSTNGAQPRWIKNKEKFFRKKSEAAENARLDRIIGRNTINRMSKPRLKFAGLSPGYVITNAIKYIILNRESKINKNYLLCLLNSTILNWRFELFSSQNNIRNYEIEELPIPRISEEDQRPFIILADFLIRVITQEQNKEIIEFLKELINTLTFELYLKKFIETNLLDKIRLHLSEKICSAPEEATTEEIKDFILRLKNDEAIKNVINHIRNHIHVVVIEKAIT